MLHRIREACGPDLKKLRGIIEIDECFVGGIEANKHEHKKLKAGRGTIGKTPVLGMREKGGRTIAKAIANTDAGTVQSGFARRSFRPPLGGCQAMRLRRGRSPIDRQMDCKRFLWKDVLKLRREQLTAARQKQPALFELQDDVRPKSQRTAAGRLGEPTLEGKALDNGT
jgi:hypothetical protein